MKKTFFALAVVVVVVGCSVSGVYGDELVLSDMVIVENPVSNTPPSTEPDQTDPTSEDISLDLNSGVETSPSATTTIPSVQGEIIAPVSQSQSTKAVTLHIRVDDSLIYEGSIEVVANSSIDIEDSAHIVHAIASDTVLALLKSVDDISDTFALSDVAFYPSFNAFLINCIQIGVDDNKCYNWQFAVNGEYPFVGMDAYTLSDGDDVYVYFGAQKRLAFGVAQATTSVPFDVRAEKYDFNNNLWIPLVGVTIGRTIPDPQNPYSPIELATSTVSSDGVATFVVDMAGMYDFGIKDDYYYPLYSIIVASSSISLSDVQNNTSGGSSHKESPKSPDIEKMFSFLDANQLPDGSFGADLYTDWVALAYGSTSGHSAAKDRLKQFLKTDVLDGSTATDYERRAMAMMAMGLDPYNDGATNYIEKIVSAFDGTQFGSKGLYNDDIFAIIALRTAGYSRDSILIQSAKEYIISKQKNDGSFESVDITAAAIQALALAGDNVHISNARSYITGIQGSNGGFGNSFATSWVMQSLSLIGESLTITHTSNISPLEYLYNLQQLDGGIELVGVDNSTRVWATAYAILGAQGLEWDSVMTSFEMADDAAGSGNSSEVEDEDTFDTPVLPAATSTPVVATSTIVVDKIVPFFNIDNQVDVVTVDIENKSADMPGDNQTEDHSNLALAKDSGVIGGLAQGVFTFVQSVFMIVSQWINKLLM